MVKEEAIQKKLEKIGHTFVILSGKGGVGKSTIACNLAIALSQREKRTGLLDIDIHGPSIPKLLGLNGRYPKVEDEEIIPIESNGVKVMSIGFLLNDTKTPVIWRGPLKANMIKEFLQSVKWGELDFLVVDSPPGTGDEPLSIAQYMEGKASAIVVTTPQDVATIDVEKCVTFCNAVKLPIEGVIENMSGFVCPKCKEVTYIFSQGGGRRLCEKFGIEYLGSIPIEPEIVRSGEEEKPYILYNSNSESAKSFLKIVDKILERRMKT